MKKILTVLIIATTLTAGTGSLFAETPPPRATCEQTLAACKLLLADKDAIIQTQSDLITKVIGQRNDLIKSEDKMPWYFWVILGAAGGVILTRGVTANH